MIVAEATAATLTRVINRLALPPYPPEPPPGEGFEAWEAEEAGDEALSPDLLAERDATVVALAARALAVRRLLLLWGIAAVAVLGWAAVGLAVRSIEDGGLGLLSGLVALVLAAVLLVPAAVALGLWVRRNQEVRDRLDAWAYLGPEPVTDERVRAHGRSVLWLLPSVALCLAGTAVAGRAATRMDTVTLSATSYALGLGGTLLVTGLLGLVRSVGHQRWAGRLLDPVPVRRGGGAHR